MVFDKYVELEIDGRKHKLCYNSKNYNSGNQNKNRFCHNSHS